MADIGLEIKNLNNMIHRYFANLKTTELLNELTGSNGYIIVYLMNHKDGLVRQKNIEEVLGITRSTASIVLSNMEKNQIITRRILPTDSRIKSIHITDKGKEIFDNMELERVELENKLRKGFSDDEVEQFLSFIKRIKRNIKEETKC
ncbi:MAG: MarR family winged helix-turn-helix transcriptional regulator [Roseburia sp.]|nr:MarR family winged helix-turn-helix transcriptional regulator [Anaeroplasma bactoclasticum]MCM1196326.1 MarR family winged helix-turn-helix transcriptional regulator [Roseburia sp.]MCM1557563.1 MarR family winged helix-turn-helix transcriptional regulator [Anaeroplasma bactoclasticum]